MGKEILIKAVIQSIPSYMMGVFKIPDGVCEDIEKLANKFWWKTSDDNNGSGIIW